MRQSARSYMFAVVVLAFALIGSGLLVNVSTNALAKNDQAAEKAQGNSRATNSKTNQLRVKAELKNFEKATRKSLTGTADTRTPGTSNANLHKEKIEKVTETLQEVAEGQETAGNTEVSTTLETVATEAEQDTEEVTDAIAEVESQNPFKKLLVGTDYKNLGQLRSSLVKNRNQIRKLTRVLGTVQTPEEKTALEQSLLELTQERERIKTVITDNESSFSFLGWVSRLLSGYPTEPIDETDEAAIEHEVTTALENTDTTTPPTTTPTTGDTTQTGTETGTGAGDTTVTPPTAPTDTSSGVQ